MVANKGLKQPPEDAYYWSMILDHFYNQPLSSHKTKIISSKIATNTPANTPKDIYIQSYAKNLKTLSRMEDFGKIVLLLLLFLSGASALSMYDSPEHLSSSRSHQMSNPVFTVGASKCLDGRVIRNYPLIPSIESYLQTKGFFRKELLYICFSDQTSLEIFFFQTERGTVQLKSYDHSLFRK